MKGPAGEASEVVPCMNVRDASVGYGAKRVLEHFNVDIVPGSVVCLLGPNGVGKTTLFKSVLGLQPILGGSVTLDGEDALKMPRRDFARIVAYVPQAHQAPFAFYVRDVVAVGRSSRRSLAAGTSCDRSGWGASSPSAV